MSSPKRIDWSNLERDYRNLKTLSAVARKYGCNIPTVSYAMKKRGIKATHDFKGLGSTSGLGRYGEKIALILLPGSIDLNEQSNVNAESDVIWNQKKINVKTSRLNPSVSRGKIFPNMKWEYKIVNPAYKTDERKESSHYFFIGLDENDVVEKVFLVPSHVLGKKACIGRRTSKYDVYSANHLLTKSALEEIHALKLRLRQDHVVEGAGHATSQSRTQAQA